MIQFGGFSPAFADVVILTDVVIILIALLMIFIDRISATCATVLHRASAMLACLIAHIGVRQR